MKYKLGLIAFLLLSFSPQEKESKTIYFLLNKDSQKIKYHEVEITIKSIPYRLGWFDFDNSFHQEVYYKIR